ncbi:MAG TPA: hypothetical protein VL576_02360 [Candidatus Paceibacterota bacterium]|jgi:hypothetical protein|nr:hypothetical protein [Candidatus Paceibacterota bacterium]
MEPIVSTSFIPKRPVSTDPVASSSAHHRGSMGLLSVITIVIVLGTIVAFGGVYLYQQTLVSQKAHLQQQITTAQNGLGTTFVSDMQRLSNRIGSVKTLIDNHVVVSPIFAALQATTLQTVQYRTFTYQFTTDPGTNAKLVQVEITGIAKDYNTLALQSDAFAQSTLIKNPVFSNLTVEDKTSLVDFKLVFTVNPSSLSYESFITGKQAANPSQSSGSTTPNTPTH